MEAVHWKIKSFIELSVTELYEILKIRQQVFVVEQACYYLVLMVTMIKLYISGLNKMVKF